MIWVASLPPSPYLLHLPNHSYTYLHGTPKAANTGENDNLRGINLPRAVEKKAEDSWEEVEGESGSIK